MKFINWISPLKCIICDEPVTSDDHPLCVSCEPKLLELLSEPCGKCGVESGLCCCYPTDNIARKFFLMWYDDIAVKKLIHRMKRRSERRATDFLAKKLADKIFVYGKKENGFNFSCVCNVPRMRKSVVRYGFDQSELLAKSLASYLGVPYIGLLTRAGRSMEQKALSGVLRTKNVKGNFMITPSVLKKSPHAEKNGVLLVDDVTTSGATISECAAVLKKYGFKTVEAALLAQTVIKKSNV